MSKKISRVDKYEASAEAILAMLQDRDYVDAKYQALGDISTSVETFETTDDGLSLKVDRQVPADLPGFAKKIMGDTNRIVQTENWGPVGEGSSCDLKIEFPGKPLHVTGKLDVNPTGDSTSDWVVNMEISASVPLVGGKLEDVVKKETLQSLDKEYAFNQEWLANH
jgi:hypothetical protein